jgi:hypothetical protein
MQLQQVQTAKCSGEVVGYFGEVLESSSSQALHMSEQGDEILCVAVSPTL